MSSNGSSFKELKKKKDSVMENLNIHKSRENNFMYSCVPITYGPVQNSQLRPVLSTALLTLLPKDYLHKSQMSYYITCKYVLGHPQLFYLVNIPKRQGLFLKKYSQYHYHPKTGIINP